MTELCAIKYSDARAPKRCRMSIAGDAPIDSCSYESPELRVICRADLLTDGRSAPAPLIARLYKQHGDSFVKNLRGTFAIILYDYALCVLKAWTDHFGAERLLYTDSRRFFAVSTDLRLLLPLFDDKPSVEPAAIQEYLQYTSIPAPNTIYKGIFRLEPGHQLTSHSTTVTHPYWDMSYEVKANQPEQAWKAGTADAIRSAVALNLSGVKSANLGCFLSGGTDSSSIAGLISRLTNQPPRTFSIGFDDARYNEMNYARIAAAYNGADHHEYFVEPDDILKVIDKAVRAYDEPFGNSSIVPTYYCARLAAENNVTHLLAGDGGDELFGGNSRYADDRVFQLYGSIPIWMRQLLIEPAVSRAAERFRLFDLSARYLRRAKIGVPDRFFSYSLLSSTPRAELFSRDFLAAIQGRDPLTVARKHFYSAPASDDLNRWLYMDLKMTITDNDLRKVTVMSRLAGMIPRFPFLNPTLAEFTGTIPPKLKVRRSDLRYLFKKAMAGILPPETIAKRKHGFGLPYSVWLREFRPLRDFTRDVLSGERFRQRGYFRKDLMDRLWTGYESVHQKYYGDTLWIFLMLELWHLNREAAMECNPTRQQRETISRAATV